MSPDTVRVTAETLSIAWPDGQASLFKAGELRSAARDAASLRQTYNTGTIEVSDNLEITGYEYVGAYGLNIHFSDGHNRAIYPFLYLRELRGLTTS